ncbi:hypothetical protein C8T65DRAFT_654764 [Cerioporus squamosus]|nr:hypothetical protein C8T65DRAFT_654764 [Cerioporus squamosus]
MRSPSVQSKLCARSSRRSKHRTYPSLCLMHPGASRRSHVRPHSFRDGMQRPRPRPRHVLSTPPYAYYIRRGQPEAGFDFCPCPCPPAGTGSVFICSLITSQIPAENREAREGLASWRAAPCTDVEFGFSLGTRVQAQGSRLVVRPRSSRCGCGGPVDLVALSADIKMGRSRNIPQTREHGAWAGSALSRPATGTWPREARRDLESW